MTPPSEKTEKLAIALGWMKCVRNGVEVWYDPEGGHVMPHELAEWIDRHINELIDMAGEASPEDLAALEKLGDLFRKET